MNHKTILVIFLFLLLAGTANAVDRYASPAGSGSTCSSGTPCSLATAISQAMPGESVILTNGIYLVDGTLDTARSGTLGNPITIRALNRRQATIKYNQTSQNTGHRMLDVFHSYITIRGIVWDGNTWSWDSLRVNCVVANPTCTNIIIEDNRFTNMGGRGVGIHNLANNGIVRYNEFDSIGLRYIDNNTPLYIGSSSPTGPLNNWEMYGNYVSLISQVFGENLLDLKSNVAGWNVHHNYFAGLISGNDGCVTTESNQGHIFTRNIMKNSDCGSATFDRVFRFGNFKVTNNVFNDASGAAFIWYIATAAANAVTEFNNNIFCNLSNYSVQERNGGGVPNPTGITFSGNQGLPGGVATSICNAEEAVILSEIAQRPTLVSGSIAGSTPNKVDLLWTSPKFPLLTSADFSKFTCTVGGVDRPVTAATIVGTLGVQLTLTSPVTGGQAVVCAGTLGAVVNSGRVGATWISDLADSAAFSGFAVTNNIGTVVAPPSPIPLRRFIHPEAMYPGDPTALTFRDENGNGIRDTVPPPPQHSLPAARAVIAWMPIKDILCGWRVWTF